MVKDKETYYTQSEIYNILDTTNQSKMAIMMPNEIFEDLIHCTEFKNKISNIKGKDNTIKTYKKDANAKHIAFAFSYIYLASYLYRYAKLEYLINEYDTKVIDDKIMYKILNTSPNSRGTNGVSYITKKGGLLEKLGYLRKELDYPISFHYERDKYIKKKVIDYSPSFSMHSDLRNEGTLRDIINKNNTYINYPVKAFFLCEESEKEDIYDGYFYEPLYCTKINIRVFIHCMSRKDLGTIGFYLYCFLKSKVDFYNTSYKRSIDYLAKDTGIGKTKLVKTLKTLEEYNMISNSHNYFVPNLPQGKAIPANSYNTKEYKDFLKSGKKTVATRKVMPFERYDKEVGEYISIGDDFKDTTDEINIELPLNM